MARESEFLAPGVAAVALVGVLLFGILQGVVVAAIASILLLIHHVAFLGRIPGTRRFSDLARHQDNERIPGVLAFRVESGIVYFNVDHVFQVVLDRVEAKVKTLRLVVCDLSTSPAVDLAGARMFLDLHTELAKRGIILHLVRPMLPSVTCFAWKELRIGLVALTGLQQWLMPSSISKRAPLEPPWLPAEDRAMFRKMQRSCLHVGIFFPLSKSDQTFALRQPLEKGDQVVGHDPLGVGAFALRRPDAMMIGRTENNSNTSVVPAKYKLRVLMFLDVFRKRQIPTCQFSLLMQRLLDVVRDAPFCLFVRHNSHRASDSFRML
jgi:hypothetical protein